MTALALVVSGLTLAGCITTTQDTGGTWEADAPGIAPAGTADGGWRAGKWWAYNAVFEGNVTIDVTLIVSDDAAPDHFTVGTNLTAGFFGLPFHGNVTRPNLNPVIAQEEWPLYRFPLKHGKEWDYSFFDHTLTTRVSAVTLDAPGVGPHEGFQLTSSAFGRTVVEYTYSPAVEWFTELVIYEPTDGREVVRVTLTEFGPDYADAYYVSVPVHVTEREYPALPDSDTFRVPGDFLRLTASALLQGRLGTFDFTVNDPDGREAMSGEVRPHGVLMTREEFDARPGAWQVKDTGAGDGRLVLEVTGVRAARHGGDLPPDAVPPPPSSAHVPVVNFAALLANAHAPGNAEKPVDVARALPGAAASR